MTAAEMMIHMRHLARKGTIPQGSQGAQALFNYLADHLHLARLASGERLLDASDFAAFLRELGEAARPRIGIEMQRKPINRIDHLRSWPSGEDVILAHGFFDTMDQRCPRCGHVHQGAVACGHDLGSGRICRCELPVPA